MIYNKVVDDIFFLYISNTKQKSINLLKTKSKCDYVRKVVLKVVDLRLENKKVIIGIDERGDLMLPNFLMYTQN